MLPETTSTESELPVWVIDEDGVRFSIRFALLTHNFNANEFDARFLTRSRSNATWVSRRGL